VTRIAAAMVVLLACRAPDSKVEEDLGEQHAAGARETLVGRLAPDAALDLLDGERVQLRDLVGRKPVYLKFWATWCVPCQKQMPHLEATHRKYGDRIATFAVDLGINDPVEAVREFQAAHAMTVPIAIDDGSLAERFHVAVTPQHILVDRAGVVRYVGHATTAELDRALESLLRDDPASSDPPRPAESPADAPLSLTLLDGSAFTLSAHAGRPIALTFVKTSCDRYLAKSRPAMAEACIAHARQIESLRPSAEHIVWVTIAHPVWTSTESLDAYRKRLAVSTPIGLDETATWFRHFRVRDVPTTVLLDEHGAEIQRVSGRGDDLPRALTRFR
jgi:thiol-disulfide isomerase/thioredoxin